MVMAVCPYCGEHIPRRALSCRSCKRIFIRHNHIAAARSTDETVKVVAFPEENVVEAQISTTDSYVFDPQLMESLHTGEIALFIGTTISPIKLAVKPLAILGRYAEESSDQLHLDLVPYGAFDKGVSRFHACLRHERDTFEIEDLDSSNGTWLNDARLPSRQPTPLRPGDRIRLGQLQFQVMFTEVNSRRSVVTDAEV
jgi:pSer/pThr/pTyr-binding forkhead associated (FHA) protein